MNALVGEKLSIITPKAQTTRRRILGIVNTDMHQVIFSDTPGIIDIPQYKLHEWMNAQIKTALQDADILLFMTSADDDIPAEHPMVQLLQKIHLPVCLVINKIDRTDGETLQKMVEAWRSRIPQAGIFPISALKKIHTETLYDHILSNLPEHPPYYETDALTDQTERALVSEMIREKIFLLYQKEIPYSVEVVTEEYKDKGDIIAIRSVIYVSKPGHKSIIIGKGGSAIKQTGIEARKDIEAFTGKKVFLELFVKISENWKNEDRGLKHFGYQ